MTTRQTTALLAVLLYLIGHGLIWWYAGWQVALGVFIVTWALRLDEAVKNDEWKEKTAALLVHTASITSRLSSLIVGAGAAAVGRGHADGDEQVKAGDQPDKGMDAPRAFKHFPE